MGFRFHNFNAIYRTYISRVSSPYNKTYYHPVIQSLNFQVPDYPPSSAFSNQHYLKIPLRWHFGHSHDHHHHHRLSGKEAENLFRLGLVSDIGLAVAKAFTGYLSGSTAIIADAAHSVSDVVLSGVALWSHKAAKAPKDKEHPYGHGKFETLGALGISCMLLATAGGIAWHALELLLSLVSAAPEVASHSLTYEHMHSLHHSGHHHGIDMEHPMLALTMTIISISVKEGLYWITKRAGERQGSGLMKANAWHHRSDAVSSVVTLIGVGGSILGVKILDPLAGLVVSGMILKAGLENGYQSVLELVDAAIPAEELILIRETILNVEGIKGCHRLRGRRAGSSLYLDVHIVVDPFSSVSAAHDIGENVRNQIHRSHPEVSEVFIHIDPAYLELCPCLVDQQESMKGTRDCSNNICGNNTNIDNAVHNILPSKFPEKMVVERITRHMVHDKILLQIEVSMPPDILIQDAINMAEEAEKEILKSAPNVFQASLLLRLGRPIPEYNCES